MLAGCGGARFSAIPEEDAATDAPGSSDAQPDADATGIDSASQPDSASEARAFFDGGAEAANDAASDSLLAMDGDAGAATHDAQIDADAAGIDGGEEGAVAEGGEHDARFDADAQGDADAEACVPILYFLDGDGDGYGGR
jgi:hypothetical protein